MIWHDFANASFLLSAYQIIIIIFPTPSMDGAKVNG